MSEPTATAPVCYRHPDRETWIRCQRCDNPICPDCMLPAAVGFQCPSCVKEGAKSTRSGLSPYGGQRSSNPALTSQVVIGLNVLVWIAITAVPKLLETLALIPAGRCQIGDTNSFFPGVSEDRCVGGNVEWVAGVASGAPWQVVTSMFAHEQVAHIAFNMLALYFLGPQLEAMLGRARFLGVYLVSGLCGSAAVMLFSDQFGSTLGASGAIFGIIGGFLIVALKVGGDVRSIVMWIGINVLITFTISNISWQGHLGGLIGGIVATSAIVYAPKGQSRAMLQWAGLAVIAVAAAVIIVVRAAALA